MGTFLYSLYTIPSQSWQVRWLLRSRPVEDFRLIYGIAWQDFVDYSATATAVAMARWFNLLRCFSPVPQHY
jgi:hypothetical protein